MSSRKCPKCGIVNWADSESCRRCARPFERRSDAPGFNTPARGANDYGVPPLGSFYGIGTRLLGWTHHGDGTATATVWFTFFFMPVLPLRRYSLLSPRSDDLTERGPQGFSPFLRLTSHYYFTGRLPLSGAEALRTYLYAYVLLPLALLAPLAALFLFEEFLPAGPEGHSETRIAVTGFLMTAWAGYVIFMLATLLHKSRGAAD